MLTLPPSVRVYVRLLPCRQPRSKRDCTANLGLTHGNRAGSQGAPDLSGERDREEERAPARQRPPHARELPDVGDLGAGHVDAPSAWRALGDIGYGARHLERNAGVPGSVHGVAEAMLAQEPRPQGIVQV
ncbi:hypothetical protein BE17_04130 [Sorangium cellulosum]|uniref:Uncharacterized protein n=1 Tax=Sorangium cellulosum TaxID=56 RepID=A0A150RZH8_SORCE|nr:hypothetical protein BE17_04130 [Sorangium cellulosum]